MQEKEYIIYCKAIEKVRNAITDLENVGKSTDDREFSTQVLEMAYDLESTLDR